MRWVALLLSAFLSFPSWAQTACDALIEQTPLAGDECLAVKTSTGKARRTNPTAIFNDTGDVWLATKTTTDLTEGLNLYYTNERVDDRAAALIQNGTGITWSYNDPAGTLTPSLDATLVSWAGFNTNGCLAQTAADTFTGRTLTGTSNRLTITNGDCVSGNPTFDISSSYVGQATITTLGTITTGVWNGTDVAFANIAQGSGLSVLGVTGSSTADVASIAGTANQVLRVNNAANSLAFGAVNIGSTSAVVGDLLYSNLTPGSARSVLGVTGNGTADVASIQGTADQTLVVNSAGTALAFGQLNIAAAAAITGDLPFSNLTQGSALSVLGVTGSSTADNASIAAASDDQVLRRSGTSVAFGAVNLAGANAIAGVGPVANGFTGQSSYTDGQLLIGNTTGNTLTKATLTGTTNQVNVTNGGGSITLSTPQDIHTGASPTFAGATMDNLTVGVTDANSMSQTVDATDMMFRQFSLGTTGKFWFRNGDLQVSNGTFDSASIAAMVVKKATGRWGQFTLSPTTAIDSEIPSVFAANNNFRLATLNDSNVATVRTYGGTGANLNFWDQGSGSLAFNGGRFLWQNGGTTRMSMTTAGLLGVGGSSAASFTLDVFGDGSFNSGLAVNDQQGGAAGDDFKALGDTDANLFIVDASADTVQVGSATTVGSSKFYVHGVAGVRAGTSSSAAKVGGSIFDHFTDTSVGGAEADIYTDTLAVDTFSANGDKVIASYGGNFVTVGTELTQLKVKLAGTTIWDSTGVAPTTGTTSWRINVELIRVSSTVVRYTVSLNTTGASGYVYTTSGELTGLTLSGTNILKITGTSTGVGSGAGDIVGKMGYVEFKPAA